MTNTTHPDTVRDQALKALQIADDFCCSLTSDVCSDSVHIPIQEAIRALKSAAPTQQAAPSDLVAALRSQRQLGADGCMVGVSRQAVDEAVELIERYAGSVQEPVAWRAWFDEDNGARWLFSLWPDEERLDVEWQPLYTRPAPAQAEPACETCSGHGAVGNILNAEPCPDCTPKAEQPAASVEHKTLVTLTGAQLVQALDYIAPDRDTDADQLECEASISFGDGHSGKGYYCWATDYAEEGAILLEEALPEGYDVAAQPAQDEREGYTDGGRNMFYEGTFEGETARLRDARLRWANDMRAAFERHTGNGWFDRDWHQETGIWAAAWRAALSTPPMGDDLRLPRKCSREIQNAIEKIISQPDFLADSGLSNFARAFRLYNFLVAAMGGPKK